MRAEWSKHRGDETAALQFASDLCRTLCCHQVSMDLARHLSSYCNVSNVIRYHPLPIEADALL